MNAQRQQDNILKAHALPKPLSPSDFANKYANKKRTGKTERDRKNGNQFAQTLSRCIRWIQSRRVCRGNPGVIWSAGYFIS